MEAQGPEGRQRDDGHEADARGAELEERAPGEEAAQVRRGDQQPQRGAEDGGREQGEALQGARRGQEGQVLPRRRAAGRWKLFHFML